MVTGRKTKKSLSTNKIENLFKIKKRYKKSFLKSAFILWMYQIKYSIVSRAADFFFGERGQKPTKMLRFFNRSVNRTICKCQTRAEECEYYKRKIEKINAM